MPLTFDYALPVHNEEAVLAGNVLRLVHRLAELPGSRVLLVENGSRDNSWQLCQQLAQQAADTGAAVPVLAFRELAAGIGHAYHRGLQESLAGKAGDRDRYVVLTAADLPFGFTDLDGVLAGSHDRAVAQVWIGSKAHAQSVVAVDTERRLATRAYRVARRLILGMRTADSQGTVFVPLSVAEAIVPQVHARGFFYSTEFIHFVEKAQVPVVELPVVLEASRRASTVQPLKHGAVMAAQLLELRTRSFRP